MRLIHLDIREDLLLVTSSRKKINIAKIRMNSNELQRETESWYIPKTPWTERVFHLCESLSVEDENHFLLKCPAYTHIRPELHSIFYNTNLSNLLTFQHYSELGNLLAKIYEHRNKILEQTK